MEWKLLTYVKVYKDFVNFNIGYYGSMSWGNVVSRNESGALVEMEYFVDKNKHVSVTIGGVIGSAIDYFYGDTWKLSGGLIVGSSVRF